jgi:hypothetical protein
MCVHQVPPVVEMADLGSVADPSVVRVGEVLAVFQDYFKLVVLVVSA